MPNTTSCPAAERQRRRDFFAAHAPAEIPAWFKIEFPPEPPLPSSHELTDKQRSQWEGLGDWLCKSEVDPEVIAYRDRYHAALKAIEKHSRDRAAALFAAWPWHYADIIIAAGASPPRVK